MIDFTSIQQMLEDTAQSGLPLWDNIRRCDCHAQGITPEQSWEKMSRMLGTMKASDRDYREEDRSHSGLVGGDGGKMARYARQETTLCGPFLSQVMAGALRMGECNACMKRIVAAPTAGACGVLPAVLVPLYRRGTVDEEAIVRALYVAAGIGAVVGYRASISGASGGCQAEVGTAAAMAAGALVDLRGGGPEQIGHAVAMALKNLMGLVCDPVAGLVEVPCVKRNVIGAVNAVSAADMALAGIESRVPVDQVIDCMGDVGRRLPVELRETALGGLAATPFGQSVKAKREERRSQEQEL